MRKYIFATDVDGTLLMDNNEVNPITAYAFNEAKKNGHYGVIATGRGKIRTLPLLKQVPSMSYFVCNNGCLIYDVENEKVLSVHPVNPKFVIPLYEFAKKNNIAIKIHTVNGAFFTNDEFGEPANFGDKEFEKIKKKILDNPDKMDVLGDYITQISLRGPEQFCKEHIKELQKQFKKEANIVLTNSIYIDLNPLNTSKWHALKELATMLKVCKRNGICTFGDSTNDYEMLKGAKENGFPLSNSKPELKELIEPKIGSNNTGAIGEKIMEIINKNNSPKTTTRKNKK